MKTTARKRRATKSGRRAGKPSSAQHLQDSAGTALRHGRDTMSRAYDWAHEAAGNAHLPSLRMPRRSDIAYFTEANPLLLGAVGLGLGVAIGTLFPRGVRRARSAGRRAPLASPAPVKARRRRRKKNGAAATG
jgi:hypothetical protein